jgi:dihydrofolate reductase
MRELKYLVHCTVDGFIARADGSWDFFLAEGEHLDDLCASYPETVPAHLREALGVRGENRWFDAVLMGRKTYEVGLPLGVSNPYPQMKQYLFSRALERSPDANVTLVSGDPVAFVKRLKEEPGKDIWLCGGGELAATLASEIDELILKVDPVLLGSGIRLFSGAFQQAKLKLAVSHIYSNGFMLLRYRVQH